MTPPKRAYTGENDGDAEVVAAIMVALRMMTLGPERSASETWRASTTPAPGWLTVDVDGWRNAERRRGWRA